MVKERRRAATTRIRFAGAMTALVTPFRRGKIDFDALGRIIEEQVAAGIDGLVPCGTTGEACTLSHAEHKEVVRFTVRAAAGRTKVLAGTGSNSTAEAIELTCDAAKAGADGALLVSPYYNKPTQEGQYLHFKAVGETSGLPIVLYSIPSRCGVEIAVPTLVRLSALPSIAGLKEAGGSIDRVSSILSACDLCVVSGDDSLTLPMMAVGAAGVISVVSNLLPGEVKQLVEAVRRNEWEAARALHYRLLPIVRLLFVENNPVGIKTALSLAGRTSAEVRAPLGPMQPDNVAKLERALAEYGLKTKK